MENILAPNIERYLDKWGLTRAEFSERLGITRQWLWELMKPDKQGIHFSTLRLLVEKTEWDIGEWLRIPLAENAPPVVKSHGS